MLNRRGSFLFSSSFCAAGLKFPKTGLFINGEFVQQQEQKDKSFPVFNPATNEQIAEVTEASTEEDVDRAVQAANTAFETKWRKCEGSVRRDLLLKFADEIQKDSENLARLETLNNGKPLAESRDDVAATVKCFRFFAGYADKKPHAGSTVPVEGASSGTFFAFTKQEPIGPIAAIVPFNYPLLMAAWKLAPALTAGCTVILKPCHQTPLSALRLAELSQRAFGSEFSGVLNVVNGRGSTGDFLVRHPLVRKIAFTGSNATGTAIAVAAASCSESPKLMTLEMGGKSALAIDEKADVDKAVACVVPNIFSNAGQICSAASRILVHKSVYDEFLEKFVKATSKLKMGNSSRDWNDHSISLGPVISRKQKDKILNYLEQGTKMKEHYEYGSPEKIEPDIEIALNDHERENGFFVRPRILSFSSSASSLASSLLEGDKKNGPVTAPLVAAVADGNICVREEIFGPVACVMKFSSLDEAIHRSNNATQFGLAAGIFSRDFDRLMKFANSARAGTVWLNTFGYADPALPFGGIKKSGFGRDLGEESLSQYLETKSVMAALSS